MPEKLDDKHTPACRRLHHIPLAKQYLVMHGQLAPLVARVALHMEAAHGGRIDCCG